MATTAPALNDRPAPAESHQRVEVVHAIRGIAALAVALFHFTSGNSTFYVPSLMKSLCSHGWLGVEAFFVVSGFVLPYSLYRGGYRLNPTNLRRFLWKRVARLEPPYLVTIALVLLLGFASAAVPWFKGPRPVFDLGQIAAHVGYLCPFVNKAWLSPVFWTLAIECQFYLTIACIFPFVASSTGLIRVATSGALLALSSSLSSSGHLPVYLPLFLLGIVSFYRKTGLTSTYEVLLLGIASAVCVALRLGIQQALVGLLTAFAIVGIMARPWPILAFFGDISYSLYLLHVPIGGRVINLATRLDHSIIGSVTAVLAATLISIFAAYLLYRFVERPSQLYASSIRISC